MSSGADRPSKKDRQNAAREKARLIREETERKAKRRRWIVQGSVGVGILAVIAVIVIVIANGAAPTSAAGPKNMISNGIVLTSTTDYVKTAGVADGAKPTDTKTTDDGKIHIVLYEDMQCPYCKDFEIGGGSTAGDTGNDDQLAKWLDAGKITLEIHPISFLDDNSLGNKYSTRAANAMAAVAEYAPDKFWAANKALYEDQPAESTKGKTDAQILATLKGAGVDSADVTKAVHDQAFKGWVAASTKLLVDGNKTFAVPNTGGKLFSGTPTVVVDGKVYALATGVTSWGDADAFLAFVKSASGKDPNAAS